ncbi:hypothetical protein MoryE10_05750 [Methylogaea oryzae]|uniref:Putative Flp pilus-assembly TadG-like N-terminal domain-containing protein n=2 Tax=Methylogaea oryzae TaxID=1295382 RepID=A0A8D4VMH6_9GAMM|nr:hypothetical protein MoryE10_05750 [Methylogaea oryzae]
MVAWRYSQARALNVRPARQSGSVVVITAISLFVLIGMIGLALDTSHLLVNKTGLQNAMDTAALSAAAAINAGYSCDEATTQSKATLSRFLAENGNADISSHVTLDNVVYQFSDHLGDFQTSPPYDCLDPLNPPRFVRVSTETSALRRFFMQVPQDAQVPAPNKASGPTTAASAVAGPERCPAKILPVLICDSFRSSLVVGQEACIRSSSTETCASGTTVMNGNFNLLQTAASAQGAKSIQDSFAGFTSAACLSSTVGQLKTGVSAGPVANGMNTFFGIPSGPGDPLFRDEVTYPVPSDFSSRPPGNSTGGQAWILNNIFNSGCGWPPCPQDHLTYAGYQAWQVAGQKPAAYNNANEPANTPYYTAGIEPPPPAGATSAVVHNRRKICVAFVQCPAVMSGTQVPVRVTGIGGFFITRPVKQSGTGNNIYAEYLGENCGGSNIGVLQPIRMMLWKDPLSGDS